VHRGGPASRCTWVWPGSSAGQCERPGFRSGDGSSWFSIRRRKVILNCGVARIIIHGMPQAKPKSLYSVHPGVLMTQRWVSELPERTGRSLDQWILLVKKSGPPTEKERREWLKTKHNLGTNAASWIAERASGKGAEMENPEAYLEAAEGYVDQMFS